MSQSEGPLTVRDLYQANARDLNLELLAGANGLANVVKSSRIQKLGLALAGYLDYLHRGRVQVMGRTEMNYLKRLDDEGRRRAVEDILKQQLCCILITQGLDPPEELLADSRRYHVPLFRTKLVSSRAIDSVTGFLERRLAPAKTIHGVLMEVFGLGVLIIGESGIGKSECALDLVLRGHRLVSDDQVTVRRYGQDRLIGSGPDRLSFHMELRGLGIINIKDLFGISAVSSSKKVEMVIDLMRWESDQEVDRTGLEEKSYELLDLSLPRLSMPVAPGRSVATLVEVAVRIQLLKKQGYRPASEFVRQLEQIMIEEAEEGNE